MTQLLKHASLRQTNQWKVKKVKIAHFRSSYSLSTSLYFCMACSARTFLAVSVATPTKISTDVPANPLNACNLVNSSTRGGAAARAPKKAEPRIDIRSSVPEM